MDENEPRSASNGMGSSTTFERYYNLSLRYLSYRPRSEKELIDYLKKKKVSEKNIREIIQRLRELNFINDLEFAKFWIEQRMRIKPKALKVVKYELLSKGIKREIIDEIIEETGKGKEDDFENAKKLADKKLARLVNLPPEKRKEKIMGFLQRRGFDFEIIKKVVDIEF